MDYLEGNNIQMRMNFSSEIMEMMNWQNIFKVLAERNCQVRILHQE